LTIGILQWRCIVIVIYQSTIAVAMNKYFIENATSVRGASVKNT
jgi:hypothetical protein